MREAKLLDGILTVQGDPATVMVAETSVVSGAEMITRTLFWPVGRAGKRVRLVVLEEAGDAESGEA